MALAGTLLAGAACRGVDPYAPVEMEWSPMDEFTTGLPPSIRVRYGIDRERPIRVFLVEVAAGDTSLQISAEPATGADRRETPSGMARRTGACVLINGGYYWIDREGRGRQIGLLAQGGEVLSAPLDGIVWQRVRYPVARATIGAIAGGLPEISWASGSRSRTVRWPDPLDNRLGRPALAPDSSLATPWPVQWALSAGPALVWNGEARVYREEEGFFDSYIPRLHPRSAVGITDDGRLLFVVVDGRQPHSRGVYLEELATILRDLGAVRAINLDGGGSSSLVVNGTLVNRPSGSESEREIASALAVQCPE